MNERFDVGRSVTGPSVRSTRDRWVRGEDSARGRIAKGLVIPHWNPSRRLAPDSTVFCIGSCFARNLEVGLLGGGTSVTSADPRSEWMELRTNLQLGLLNKYNPASIHQELDWALGRSTFPQAAFLRSGIDWIDPHLRGQARSGELEWVARRRQWLSNYFAGALDADLVIVTLGLTEAWFDRTTKLALTEAPSPRLHRENPTRFGLRMLDYPACEKLVKSICLLLKQFSRRNTHIVLTVSPVPLERTFSGQDVIVANTTSKSVLRAAATTAAERFEGVDYYPSYEAAIVSDPSMVWEDDRRNVSHSFVSRVVAEFAHRYGLVGGA